MAPEITGGRVQGARKKFSILRKEIPPSGRP